MPLTWMLKIRPVQWRLKATIPCRICSPALYFVLVINTISTNQILLIVPIKDIWMAMDLAMVTAGAHWFFTTCPT